MRLPARVSAAALSAATALALATACDLLPDDAPGAAAPYARLTGPEVVDKALAATRAAKAVRMTVRTTTPEGPVEAYVATDVRGVCTVTLSMGAAGTLELVRTGGTVRTRSDAAMLRASSTARGPRGDAEVERLTGRWVEPADGDRQARTAERYCDRETFLGLLAPTSGTARKGRATALSPDEPSDEEPAAGGPSSAAPAPGTPALTVTGGADGRKWSVSIATEGRPYLLELRAAPGPDADGTGHGAAPVTVEFSEFGKPFTARQPKP
ncbi:hypothetical protein [Streptomyces sp. NPDC014685]|jgi:hypothetical protein|uniref:hypothetical protein n=1 Tax=Streptomyces sp. NPDC014685 TaxID=3364881 RepID=UPI0037017EC4